MTRKRTRESLAHVLCEECPTCGGRGEVKTARTVCYEILRELLREARQFNAREYRVLGSQAVIDRFLDEESQGEVSGDALRLHRQADLAAGRTQLLAGAVRHRA
jgi:Ribonuclease G/E